MSSSNEEKKVVLSYNGYKIPIRIEKDYDKIKAKIQESLYLTKEDMDKLSINFKDSEGYENMLDEDTIGDAFQSEEWIISKDEEDEDQDKKQDNEKSDKEIKKLKKEKKDALEQVNALKIKIKEISDKWKESIEKLKNNFINELQQRENLNKTNIENITKNLTESAQNIIAQKVEEYNNNISEVLKSKIEDSTIDLNNKKDEFTKNLEELTKTQSEIKNTVEQSKVKFIDIINKSKIMENNE